MYQPRIQAKEIEHYQHHWFDLMTLVLQTLGRGVLRPNDHVKETA
jgi:hypothetical protein